MNRPHFSRWLPGRNVADVAPPAFHPSAPGGALSAAPVSRKLELPPYHRLICNAVCDIEVRCGRPFAASIEAPYDALARHLMTDVAGDTLMILPQCAIGTDQWSDAMITSFWDRGGGEARFHTQPVRMGSSGEADVPAAASQPVGGIRLLLDVPTLTFAEVRGVATLDIDEVAQPSLELLLSGSGTMAACGDVGHLVMSLRGAGSVNANELHAGSATLCGSGTGCMAANVSRLVCGTLAGSARVFVAGSPALRHVHVDGLSSISYL